MHYDGLCLNALHDKAFDIGLFTITVDYKVKLSDAIADFENDASIGNFFKQYANKSITLPERYFPNKEFLEFHYHNIFIK
jgi:putative restriction endonuclease